MPIFAEGKKKKGIDALSLGGERRIGRGEKVSSEELGEGSGDYRGGGDPKREDHPCGHREM